MAKRFIITLLALTLATAAFAAGQKEQQYGALQGDKVVLKGTVSLQDFPHPVLTSGDKQYVLMVPPHLVDLSGVKDGAQVTVQGYQMRGNRFAGWGADTRKYVGFFVTQATIDGKDYDLARYYAEWMMGGGYGMMGGREYGRGWGMMGGGYGMMGRGSGMMGGGQGWGRGPGGQGYGPECEPFGPGYDGYDD